MRYLVDFDGTLCQGGKPNILPMAELRALQAQGHIVVLFTSRTGARVQEAVAYCRKHGLFLNGAIGGKPVADYYIDDKAIPVRAKEWQQI